MGGVFPVTHHCCAEKVVGFVGLLQLEELKGSFILEPFYVSVEVEAAVARGAKVVTVGFYSLLYM